MIMTVLLKKVWSRYFGVGLGAQRCHLRCSVFPLFALWYIPCSFSAWCLLLHDHRMAAMPPCLTVRVPGWKTEQGWGCKKLVPSGDFAILLWYKCSPQSLHLHLLGSVIWLVIAVTKCFLAGHVDTLKKMDLNNKEGRDSGQAIVNTFFVVLEFGLRAPLLVGRHSITWATPPALFCIGYFLSFIIIILILGYSCTGGFKVTVPNKLILYIG
jgi:hypothetical protein